MQRLTYVLQFHRPAGSGDEAPVTAPGAVVTTRLEAAGVATTIAPLEGATAALDLSYRLNGDGTLFLEWGTLHFGDDAGSSVTFSSVGAGTLGAADVDGFSHGLVTYSVTSGTGQFDGASGLITSNFLLDATTNELIDTHLGVIRTP